MSTIVPPLALSAESKPENQLVRFGASLRSAQKENVWTPRIQANSGVPINNSQGLATPNTAFYGPSSWLKEYTILTRRLLEKDGFIALHKNTSAYELKGKIKLAFYVQPIPSLASLRAAIPVENNEANYDALWKALYIPHEKVKERARVEVRAPVPAIWAVTSSEKSDIIVVDALSGSVMLCFRNCKSYVGISCISHAPFLGLIDKQLNVIPIERPADLLPLKEQNLIETDFMWVGFSDGAIRLFPANHENYYKVSEKVNEEHLTDVVFEVPKFHASAIVGITTSPSLADCDALELSDRTRLSTLIKHLRAGCGNDAPQKNTGREHLSLVCTASVDSVVVVWDLKSIYQSIQEIRDAEARKQAASFSFLSSVDCAKDVITIERIRSPKSMDNVSSQPTTQMRCILVNARPLLRLKGSVAGLTCLSWVSSLVTTEGYRPEREAALATRDPLESSASVTLKSRRPVQTTTRFDRREGQRRILELSEEDMCEVERELRILLPPLAREKPQSKRVNLLLAGDSTGTVHVWDLDEELRSRSLKRAGVGELSQVAVGQMLPGEISPSIDYATGTKTKKEKANAYIQTDPVHSPSTPLGKAPVEKRQKQRNFLPSGYISAAPPKLLPEKKDKTCSGTSVPPINIGSALAKTRALRQSPGRRTPRLSRLQLLAAERSGTVPEKLRILDSNTSIHGKPHQRRSAGKATTSRQPMNSSLVKNTNENMEESMALPSQTFHASMVLSPLLESSYPFELSFSKSTPWRTLPTPGFREHAKTGMWATQRPSPAGKGLPTSRASCSISTSRLLITSTREVGNALPASSRSLSPAQSLWLDSSRRTGATRRTARSLWGKNTSLSGVVVQKASKTQRKKAGSVPLVVQRSVVRGPPRIPIPKGFLNAPNTSRLQTSTPLPLPSNPTTDALSRTAKCRIEFTGGGAVLGMAVQVPSEIRVTMRRIPNPPRRERSLLEDPKPEEIERRALENSFTELNDSNALFFVFQYLQLHLCVEGAVLDFRFVPQWTERDPDGKDLFRKRNFADVARKMEHPEEVTLSRCISLPSFVVHIRKLVLDAHSQPVSAFYFNRDRQHLWVGRNDGLLTVFSSENKYIVSRVPHPSAIDALGPPDPIQWAQQLQRFLRESKYMKGAKKLEKHRETLAYGEARFTGFLPFCRKAESSFALIYRSQDYSGKQNEKGQSLATASSPESWRWNSRAEFFHLDGRASFSALDRKHERHLNVFLNYLKLCRSNADKVRQANRSLYYTKANRVKTLLAHMDSYTAARFSELMLLRKAFEMWRAHLDYFPFSHYTLRLKKENDARNKSMAATLLHLFEKEKCSRYYYKWRMWVGFRRINMYYTGIARMTRLSQHRLMSPSVKQLEYLETTRQRREVFRAWKQLAWNSMAIESVPPSPSPSTAQRRKNERDRSPQRRPRLLAPNSLVHFPDKSFKHTPLDDDTYRFLLLISSVYHTRYTAGCFGNFSNSLRESWVEMVENAEGASASEDSHDKKVAVLSYGLLPLLQGLLVTANELSLNAVETPGQLQEVQSMLQGMQLCLDYILEDPEEYLAQLIIERKVEPDSYEENKEISDSKGEVLLFRRDTAVRGIIHYFLLSNSMDDDNLRVVREIAQSSDDLMKLLLLAQNHTPF